VNEHAKIKEAQYFLSLLPELKNDRDKFIHNLSAFLTAGRSALQYAREEAEGKRKGLRWYDRHVASSKIIRFLKEKRDLNIHVNPVSPNARLTVHIKDVASFSASLLIATIREDGTIKKRNCLLYLGRRLVNQKLLQHRNISSRIGLETEMS
jgi:hypothetical protein